MKTYYKIRLLTKSGLYFYGAYFAENQELAIEKAKRANFVCLSKIESFECMGENYPGSEFDDKGQLIQES